jgi:hypothetical protein
MNIGFALCGSYCTFSKIFPVMEDLAKEHRIKVEVLSAFTGTPGTIVG